MSNNSNSFKRDRSPSPPNAAPFKPIKTDQTLSVKSSKPSSTPPPPRARVQESITPQKSPKDPNDYRVIKLSTGLTVALISRKNLPLPGDIPTSTYRCTYKTRRPASFPNFYQWPSLQHSIEPEYHFIEPNLKPWLQDPVCEFISTPALTNVECQDDGDTIYDPSTVFNRTCANKANTTSVAAVVNSGGLEDPPNCEGLHHFTEHMVHYGSTRFPSEDAVNSLVANFGTYNATTRSDTTNYYNEVPDVILERNLERFSDMLAQPIFNMEVIRREVYAVDNEFYLRLPVWRRFLLQNHVSIKKQGHPLKRFICGSLETLGEGKDAGNKIVQDIMKENHENKYVASAMTVSMNSTKTLDEMQELAVRHFSHLRQGARKTFMDTPVEKTTTENLLHPSKHVYLQGLTSGAELTMVWHLPASLWTDNMDEHVLDVVIHMLSETGPVGLNMHLQNRDLIFGMYAYPHCNKYATILEINFYLTEMGRKHANLIEDATFEYIQFLGDQSNELLMKRLFEEMKLMHLREYHYGSQMTSLDTTQEFAMRLQYVESNNLLLCESWSDSKFNFARIQETLSDMLTFKHLMVIETVPRRKPLGEGLNAKVQRAPFSNAKFVEIPRNNQAPSTMGPTYKFGFRSANSFLKPDFDSMSRQLGCGDARSFFLKCPTDCGDIQPQQLSFRSKCDLQYQEAIPKISGYHRGHSGSDLDRYLGQVSIVFVSQSVFQPSTRTNAIFRLWTTVIEQKLVPYASELEMAGFHVSVAPRHGSLRLCIGGFPRDIEKVVEIVIKAMLVEDQVDDPKILSTRKVFDVAKERLKNRWEQVITENDVIAQLLVECCTYKDAEMSLDFLGYLNEITPEDLDCFMEYFKGSTFSILELRGNLPLKTFDIVANLLERMPYAPILDSSQSLYSTKFLPLNPELYSSGETCIRVKNLGSPAFTTTVLNCYALGTYGGDQREADLFGAAMNFMNCQAFMDLRTKQQLGYSVYVRKAQMYKVKNPVMMFYVAVTSTACKYTTCELDQKIDIFLEDYKAYLTNMPDDLFQTKLKLTCTPRTITKHDVATWFHEKIPGNFGKRDIKWKCLKAGIKKQSIQILSGNDEVKVKECNCGICGSISGWKRGNNFDSQLRFAEGKGISERYFVSSPKF